MRRLYVGALLASRQQGTQIDNQIQSFTLLARSQDEAEGMAYRWMRAQWPSARGYGWSGQLSPQTRVRVSEWLAAYDEDATT